MYAPEFLPEFRTRDLARLGMHHMLGSRWGMLASVLGLSLAIAGCQTTAGDGDAGRAWTYGMHRVPPASLRDGEFYTLTEIRKHPKTWPAVVARNKLKPGVKLPAVVYLHGCVGNTVGDTWAKLFGELGIAFFAPDSLARPRASQCVGNMTSRLIMRLEEVKVALAELRKADWIDQKRLILMGSSEGGHAASEYDGKDFAAIVITAADCQFSGGSPNVPGHVPVLNMVGQHDKEGGGFGCAIRREVGSSRKLIIKDAGHKLATFPEARQTLRRFLRACCAIGVQAGS